MTININDLTIGQVKEINDLFCDDVRLQPSNEGNHPFEIGANYLIRTVTMAITGKLKNVGDKELTFSDAAWIADTGRFHDALKDIDVFKEVEPFVNDAILGRGSIIDATIIKDLPKIQK